MSQCPVCKESIEDSFGLVECPSCHKILFADFDGTLKIHEGEPNSSHESSENFSSDFPNDKRPEQTSSGWDLNKSSDSLDQLDPIMEPIPQEVNVTDSPLDEINQFANSEDSSLNDGMLIYNLIIKNIDTEDLKEELLEVLKEKKLNIDMKSLKFSLPTLELKDLNPIKASVIISRIKHLPLDVEWGQKSVLASQEIHDEID